MDHQSFTPGLSATDANLPYNPTRAGFGPWPQVIADEDWIALATHCANEIGIRNYLIQMLQELRRAYAALPEMPPGAYTDAALRLCLVHLAGKRVTGVKCNRQGQITAIVFEDGHTLPIVQPGTHRFVMEAQDIEGKYLLGVLPEAVNVRGHPADCLVLYFHPQLDAVVQLPEASPLASSTSLPEGLTPLYTLETSSSAIFCPQHLECDRDTAGLVALPFDPYMAAIWLDTHLAQQRVADVRQGKHLSLIFDDGHTLPVIAPMVTTLRRDLELYIGRFLVWVAVEVTDPAEARRLPTLRLYFYHDPSLYYRLCEVQTETASYQLMEVLESITDGNQKLVLCLTLAVDSAVELECPMDCWLSSSGGG